MIDEERDHGPVNNLESETFVELDRKSFAPTTMTSAGSRKHEAGHVGRTTLLIGVLVAAAAPMADGAFDPRLLAR